MRLDGLGLSKETLDMILVLIGLLIDGERVVSVVTVAAEVLLLIMRDDG